MNPIYLRLLNALISLLKTIRLRISSTFGFSSINGSNFSITLGEVYEKYCLLHLPTVTEATRVKYCDRAERFLRPRFHERMANLTPEKIAEFISQAKGTYIQGPYSKRYNFKKEVKDLRSLVVWWSDHYDYKFKNPVRPFHMALSVMEEIPEKDRKISMEETARFFEAMPQGSLYRDIATVQFYCGGRIGEIVGIQLKNIDLDLRILKIKEVITWVKGVPRVKPFPKNGKAREVFINDTLLDLLKRRLKKVPQGCLFLFHDAGRPLRYNRVNVAFNEAWKRAGLSEKFSGSHLMRFSSAQAARKITGSLDAAASVTGHQSMRMAAHYGKLDSVALNQSSVIQIESYMKGIKSTLSGSAKSANPKPQYRKKEACL